MSISAVVLNGTIQHQQNLSILKQNADDKGMTDQSHIATYLNKYGREKLDTVEFSNRARMQQKKQDAKEKGRNAYHGDGGKHRNEHRSTGVYYDDWDEGTKELVVLKMPTGKPMIRFDLKI